MNDRFGRLLMSMVGIGFTILLVHAAFNEQSTIVRSELIVGAALSFTSTIVLIYGWARR